MKKSCEFEVDTCGGEDILCGRKAIVTINNQSYCSEHGMTIMDLILFKWLSKRDKEKDK